MPCDSAIFGSMTIISVFFFLFSFCFFGSDSVWFLFHLCALDRMKNVCFLWCVEAQSHIVKSQLYLHRHTDMFTDIGICHVVLYRTHTHTVYVKCWMYGYEKQPKENMSTCWWLISGELACACSFEFQTYLYTHSMLVLFPFAMDFSCWVVAWPCQCFVCGSQKKKRTE